MNDNTPGKEKVKSILVVGPSWVGDMVMAQSLFMVIRQNDPTARISVLAPKWSHAIVDRMEQVYDSIEMPVGHGALELRTRYQMALELRPRKYESAFILPGSWKSALIPWMAKIPHRCGFVGEQRWGLINDIRRLDKSRMPLQVQRYASLALDSGQHMDSPPYPKLTVGSEEKKKTLQAHHLQLGRRALVLCPGAEFGPSKRWPVQYFAQVANNRLSEGWQVWILGSDKDAAISAEINSLCGGGCVDLCGKTSLAQATDLMSCADYVLTNDSGLMHVAAAVGTYVIALYGSSSDEFTPPLSKRCTRLNLHLSCSPCFKRQCPLKHHNCLGQLTPGMVLDVMSEQDNDA